MRQCRLQQFFFLFFFYNEYSHHFPFYKIFGQNTNSSVSDSCFDRFSILTLKDFVAVGEEMLLCLV